MTSATQSLYRTHKQPTSVSYYGFAYYFYFKGYGPLKRHLPGIEKS